MPYSSPWNGMGGGKPVNLGNLIRICNFGAYDFRQNQNANTSNHNDFSCHTPGGAQNAIAWGSTNQPNWMDYATRTCMSIASSHRFVLLNNIADSQSEVFCVARVAIHRGTGNSILCRGRDGSGNGWSLAGLVSTASMEMNAVTTSGGAAARQAAFIHPFLPEKFYTFYFAYKSGAYVRCGFDGYWRAETTFTATGLRSSSVGMGINKHNSFDATGDSLYRFYGLATTIPSDVDLLNLHEEFLENEATLDLRGAVLLSSVGVGGGSQLYHNDPVLLF